MTTSIEITVQLPERPKDSALIGSAPMCDIRISGDGLVLPSHAEVLRARSRFWIRDLGEGRGRAAIRVLRGLSEHLVRRGGLMELVPGDIIVIGQTQIPWSGDFS